MLGLGIDVISTNWHNCHKPYSQAFDKETWRLPKIHLESLARSITLLGRAMLGFSSSPAIQGRDCRGLPVALALNPFYRNHPKTQPISLLLDQIIHRY